MPTPGELYKNSNKFNPVLGLAGLAVALLIALTAGLLYGLASFYNPFIYFNFIVLILAVIGVAAAAMAAKSISKSRNLFVDGVILLLAGFVAWESSWAYFYWQNKHLDFTSALTAVGKVTEFAADYSSRHVMSISRHGSHGLEIPQGLVLIFYVVEFAAFFVPLFMVKNLFGSSYYCETCDVANVSSTYYAKKPVDFKQQVEEAKKGNLRFFNALETASTFERVQPKPDVKNGERIVQIDVSNCKKCGNNAIVDIYTHTIKTNDKGKEELKDKETLVRKTYFDPLSLKEA